MKIEILCSTMYGAIPLCLNRGTPPHNIIVINQCVDEIHENKSFLNFYERGLSRSRNRGLEKSNSDICLITDNDTFFNDNMEDVIKKAFSDYPDADILTFQVETPEGELYKNYKENFFWHNKLSLAKVSSVEIAFRRESILKTNIKFDEDFGLGSYFPTSEEYIFLADAFSKGLKIGYVPKVIVYHPKESSGGAFTNKELVYAKGAMINRIFGKKGILICFLFSLKKYRYSGMSFLSFFKLLSIGYLKYRKKSSHTEF
ncbi:glycosyltransferase [Acinetobacter sp. 3657]|uniref:glycosyltransferase n=1 Tax=Acinetobacter sp. 3657 TaxID=2817764 RepID=UPI00285BE74D|nr:glycosyltransferase involved in cell wall biosynthesis [Prolinoborus sp. 3657]